VLVCTSTQQVGTHRGASGRSRPQATLVDMGSDAGTPSRFSFGPETIPVLEIVDLGGQGYG
jgi:hypothetical protein